MRVCIGVVRVVGVIMVCFGVRIEEGVVFMLGCW